MDNVRILKGYSDDEQKELENAKKYMDCSDLLHIITDFISGTRFNLIWEKYNEAEPDEQISIIKDILDFYCGNAKFPEKKYVVHDKGTDQYIFYNVTGWSLCWGRFDVTMPDSDRPEIMTKEEWLAFNPAYGPMLEKAED